MSYNYALTVIDEGGNMVLDYVLTADQAVSILADAMRNGEFADVTAREPQESLPQTKRKARGAAKTKDKSQRKPGKTRERVIALRVQGKSLHEIADELGISYSAVNYHIARDAGTSAKNWGGGGQAKAKTPDAKALTEDQYDNLKHLQNTGDLSSRDYAERNGLALTEVNRAISSASFADYRDW